MNDAQLDTVLVRHPHASGVQSVVSWLRAVAAPLRPRALSCYAAGLAPQALCDDCRREVPAGGAVGVVSPLDCVRCAARTVAESLASEDDERVRRESVELAARLRLEAERGAHVGRARRHA
jgi:hypothetical protein